MRQHTTRLLDELRAEADRRGWDWDELSKVQGMPYQLYAPAQYLQATPGVALANSVTATDISANPQYVLNPNAITTVGQSLRIRAAGVFSNTGTPTLILGAYKNTTTSGGGTGVSGTAMAATAATTTTTGATNWMWLLDLTCTFTAVGSAGTLFSYGSVLLGTSATAVTTIPIPNATPQTAIAFNTTVGNILSIGAVWGTASASNTIICNHYFIELLN